MEQDPSQWPDVANAARQANLFRYHYLPYLYRFNFLKVVNGKQFVVEVSMHRGDLVVVLIHLAIG